MTIPLPSQVTSLPLSKRLKELGVPQQGSLYSWHMTVSHTLGSGEYKENGYSIQNREARPDLYPNDKKYEAYAAYTVAELGMFLSEKNWEERCNGNGIFKMTYKLDSEKERYTVTSNNEADARASMLVWLLEQKIISL